MKTKNISIFSTLVLGFTWFVVASAPASPLSSLKFDSSITAFDSGFVQMIKHKNNNGNGPTFYGRYNPPQPRQRSRRRHRFYDDYVDSQPNSPAVYSIEIKPWSAAWFDYCSRRYRSFNRRTGYFKAYSGRRVFCVAKSRNVIRSHPRPTNRQRQYNPETCVLSGSRCVAHGRRR